MNWKKTGREVKGNGETTTFYESGDGWFQIESRKRNVPHANRSGYWQHTTYLFIDGNGNEKEYWSLKDAKEAAEVAS